MNKNTFESLLHEYGIAPDALEPSPRYKAPIRRYLTLKSRAAIRKGGHGSKALARRNAPTHKRR